MPTSTATKVSPRGARPALRAVGLIVRWMLALGIVLVIGLWGAMALFSDLPAGFSFAKMRVVIIAVHLAAGLSIGALVPKRWYLALAVAWGGIMIDGIPLLVFIRRWHGYPNGTYPGSPILGFLIIPLVLAAGGYLGHRIAGRRKRAHTGHDDERTAG
jgi:hypothetical protein